MRPLRFLPPVALYLAWFGLFGVIFFHGWVSEDAYISFRVIDHFTQGYGLRWNIHERVQVYTHPLWLLLHLPFAQVFDNLFQVNLALSVACSSLAVAITLLTFRSSYAACLAVFLLPLYLSKAFIDYATSGLETSLSYLLFAVFGWVVMRANTHRLFPLLLSLASALLLLNRLDHVVLIAPWLAFIAYQNWPRLSTAPARIMLALGTLPLIGWLLFALIYYGFLAPNTKYAKLNTGFPLSDYLEQGLHYAFIWFTHDTSSVLLVVMALIVAARQARTQPCLAALGLGILFNLGYVTYIGGDYMMGRFYAVPVFAAAWLLLASSGPSARRDVLFALALTWIVAFAASHFMMTIRRDCEACLPVKGRVIDARRIFRTNALFRSYQPLVMRAEGQYKFGYEGRDLAKENPPPIKPIRYAGMIPYYAGPNAIFIDELALADPLLARLPAITTRAFYVGHYRRALPKGYVATIKNEPGQAMNTNLAEYYAKLRIITQGEELLSRERLLTILKFNIGYYEHYKHEYLSNPN